MDATSHHATGDLARRFVAEQSKQPKMADMLAAATDISGDDQRISVTLDPATMVELGTTEIPAGTDLKDVEAHADIELAADGSLSMFDVTVGSGDAGSVTIHTRYEKANTAPAMPPSKCVTKGEEYSSTDQIKSLLN